MSALSDLWRDLTVGQAMLLAVAVWLLLRLGELAAELIRRSRGTYRPGEHCEHCPVVDTLDEQVGKLVEYAHDQLAVLEEIRDAATQTAEHTAGDPR